MTGPAQRLEGFIDLLVEVVLREIEEGPTNKDADESGQEQRRRGDQESEKLPQSERPRAA